MQLQKLCMATMSRPFSCAGELVHPVLSCSRIAVNGQRLSAGDALLRIGGDAPRPSGAWAIGYHNDMAAAAGLLAELAEDRLCVRWQPVAPADDSSGFLFQEASICSVELLHEQVSQQAEIEAAERVGLSRVIDRWLVEQVLEYLGARPFVQLGVRISAMSAVVDGWWSDIFDHLGRHLDDAQRLTFIVSGATPFTTIGDAQVFTQRVRALGCRVALDNFGVGFTSLRHLVILSPDVVKIDSLFAHWAEQSDRSVSILEHGIKLAGATGAAVVVNGISTERQRAMAIRAGAQWMQGDLIAEPRFGISRGSETAAQPHAAGQSRAIHQHMHGAYLCEKD
ncbi:MAG: EAL domain-containing protein [Sphingobium sp.]